MSDSNIVNKIISSAKEKGEKVLAEAQKKHDELLKEKMTRLENEINEQLELEKKHVNEKIQQQLSSLRLAEKNKTQRLKRELLEKVYEDAWKRLSDEDYRKYLEAQLKEHASPGDEIIVSLKEYDRFKNEFKDLLDKYKVKLSTEKGRFKAGFVIPKGNIRYNCTLDQSFRRVIEENEPEAARMLFQE